MAAAPAIAVDTGQLEARRRPRSNVHHSFGPRGQLQLRVTIVTGDPDEFVDEIVLAACARIDYDLHRAELAASGGVLHSTEG